MLNRRSVLYNRKSTIISHFNFYKIVMTSITKDIEDILDELNKTEEWDWKTIILPNNPINVKCSDILLYGAIDFTNDNDIKLINKKNLTSVEPYELPVVYSNLDYKNGCITSDKEGIFRWYHTFNPVKVLMLHHCYINKPERIVIYRTKDVSKLEIR